MTTDGCNDHRRRIPLTCHATWFWSTSVRSFQAPLDFPRLTVARVLPHPDGAELLPTACVVRYMTWCGGLSRAPETCTERRRQRQHQRQRQLYPRKELDISDSQMDVPLPRIRFAEPAGVTPSLSASSPTKPPPLPPAPAPASASAPTRHRSIIAARGERGVGGRRGSRAASSPAVGGGDGDGGGIDAGGAGGDGGAFDSPRFAASLRRLVAVKTRLWNRWDLSTFPVLASLEVSYAGRTMLKQLHRKVWVGAASDPARRYELRGGGGRRAGIRGAGHFERW